MIGIKNSFKNILIVVFITISLGCTNKQPILHQLAPMITDDYCRIAVLPFINETKYINGDVLMQKVVVAELIKKGEYLLAQDGDIRKMFQQNKIYYGHSPDYEQLRIIADRLNVQLIITGQLNEMSENFLGRGFNPIIAVSLQIYDAKNGTCLWTTYHRKEGEQYRKILHFGKINSITSLAQVMSQEVIDKWFAEGFKKCVH